MTKLTTIEATHIAEVEREGADFLNMGWASGPDFIHSKTTKGRLLTERVGKKIRHTWERYE